MQLISIITGSFLLDLVLGDPPSWPHPVKLIGKLIAFLTVHFNYPTFRPFTRKVCGMVMWLIVVVGSWSTVFLILRVTATYMWLQFIIGLYFSYTCLSIKGLSFEGKKIIKSLNDGKLELARNQVGMIVGRDTEKLSTESICKATIETIAENTSDGVIAPLMYLAIGGPALGIAYKAVNTLDSMVGYKNEQFGDIGYFPAKLDDLFNYIPARLTWIFLMLASIFLKYDIRQAFKVGKRDREHHRSPNSGFSESVVAGALDLQLGGPHYYFGQLVMKPYIGDAKTIATTNEITKTIRMLYLASLLGLVMFLTIRILWLNYGGQMQW
ncbi:adenosylcobinamide-phosphate synthase CbiB [Lentilactobacillus raoultii]|uniref:Cobalamin biosynthesis protein CobD n=1 Tax=Lentilactobacillus raoultii TaxID=1987503 RepID=A0ABW3PKF0_9LACO|nr:adenosylcobinamide-phosphate synthase CbiB [Lentilactobacillus raoultii]